MNNQSERSHDIEMAVDVINITPQNDAQIQPESDVEYAATREDQLADNEYFDEESIDIRPSEVKAPVSYGDFYLKTSKISFQAAASYTFSLQMVLLTYLLSRLEHEDNQHLAAVTLIATVINSTIIVGISPLIAMGLTISKDIGSVTLLEARDQRRRERHQLAESAENPLLLEKRQIISGVLRNGFIIGGISSAVFMVPVMVASGPILTHLFFQNPEVAKIAQKFIRPYAFAVPGIVARVATDQVLYAFERTKPAMLIGLASFAFWMPLGTYLAFGHPKLGATGLLIGCGLDGYTTSLGYAAYLAYSPRFKKYNFFDFQQTWLPKHIEQMKNIRHLGRSLLLSMVTETSMTVSMSAFSGGIGLEQQAAFSAIMQVSLLTLLLQISFGQTASQAIGQYVGRNEFENASRAAKTGLFAMSSCVAILLIVLAAHPQFLLAIQKNHDHSFTHTIKALAPMMFMGFFLDATRFQLLQQLRSLGAPTKASLVSCSAIALGIALSGSLGLTTKMGIYGVATGFLVSEGFATLGLLLLWSNKVSPEAIAHTKEHPEQGSLLDYFGMYKNNRNINDTSTNNAPTVEMTTNPVYLDYKSSKKPAFPTKNYVPNMFSEAAVTQKVHHASVDANAELGCEM